MSNDQNPGCLEYIIGYTQLCGDYNKPWSGSLLKQPIQWNVTRVLIIAQLGWKPTQPVPSLKLPVDPQNPWKLEGRRIF